MIKLNRSSIVLLVCVLLATQHVVAHMDHKCPIYDIMREHKPTFFDDREPLPEGVKMDTVASNTPVNKSGYQQMRITLDVTALSSLSQSVKDSLTLLLTSITNFYMLRLKVDRVSGAIKMPLTCVQYNPPTADRTTGISNTDLHLYVSTVNDQSQSFVAWAAPCVQLSSSGRAVAGQVNLNMYYINQYNIDTKLSGFTQVQKVVLHEIMHILAFNNDLFPYFQDSFGNKYNQNEIVLKTTFLGISTTLLATPVVLQRGKKYFGCSSLVGLWLEDQGSSGSAGSHWERTIFLDELMSASAVNDSVYTQFSFAIFTDSGWYVVEETQLDQTYWGYQKGCDFEVNACSSAKTYGEYCSTSQQTGCSYDTTKVAVCTKETFSDSCMYFYQYSNGDCRLTDNVQTDSTIKFAYYGEQSHCFVTNIKDPTKSVTYLSNGQCYKSVCQGGQVTIYIGSTDTVVCTRDKQGQTIQFTGTATNGQGSFTCPSSIDSFCLQSQTRQLCPNSCSMKGVCIGGFCQCNPSAYGPDCSKTSCTSGQFYNDVTSACVSSCPANTATLKWSNSCIACHADCGTCFGSLPNNCLTCTDGTKKIFNGMCVAACPTTQPIIYNNQCYAICPDGTFQATGATTCTPCEGTCATCTAGTAADCTLCVSGTFFSVKDSKCVTSCPTGYSLSNALKCDVPYDQRIPVLPNSSAGPTTTTTASTNCTATPTATACVTAAKNSPFLQLNIIILFALLMSTLILN